MKILMLNTYDTWGGAANATYRLAEALRNNNVDVEIGVLKKRSNSTFVYELKRKTGLKIIFDFFIRIFRKILCHFFSSTNQIHTSCDLISKIDINWINNSNYDLIHLNWIHEDMLSIKDIGAIRKPIVVTLHDSWFCCGAEHHPNVLENDNRWQLGYTKMNKPKTTKGPDICRLMWKLKKNYWKRINPLFIAPSSWEKDILVTSALFKNSFCTVIPNLINHNDFFKIQNPNLRQEFSIPNDKIILGFGASYGVDNPNSIKGTYYLINALKMLPDSQKYYLVIFGKSSENFTKHLDIPFFESGYIIDNKLLVKIYNMLDIFLNPSIIESFGLTTMEAMCCGVPTVAFNTGGTTDIIEHKKNGYMAMPYSSEDFMNGIQFCSQNLIRLKEQCLLDSNVKFDNRYVVDRYIDIYKQALSL